jgi:hypothetical protein
MQLRDRHVELVAFRVFDAEEFAAAADIELDQALIAADTVIDVDDRRTDGEFRKIAQDRIRIARGEFAAARLLGAFTVKLTFAEDGERRLRERETIVELRDDDRNPSIIPAFTGLTSGGIRSRKR